MSEILKKLYYFINIILDFFLNFRSNSDYLTVKFFSVLVDMQIDEGIIKHQVSRILDTRSFKNSNILSKFLYYIVSETLDGNKESLKEYVIATNVLNRKTDFDPQLDAIVRIHARRLRNLLDQYYDKDGLSDPIKISIPKGRYIPIFEKNNTNNPIKLNGGEKIEHKIISKPVIAVLPFNSIFKDERTKIVCSVLCQDICVALTRFDEISVVSNYSTQVALEKLKDLSRIACHLNTDFLITISCISDNESVRVIVELHSMHKDQLMWAESFEFDDYKENKIANYNIVIRKVMANVGGFFGLIYRDTLKTNEPNELNQMYAIYWHNRYHRKFSEEAFYETLNAINLGLEKNPDNSLLNSFKAELYLNLKAMDIQGDIDYHSEGHKLVSKALDLDQKNQHAWEVYAWANLMDHDKKEYLRSAEKCISLNPNNSMYSGSIGFGYECAGEYEKGLELMSEAINLNPYYHWNINIGFCFYYLSHQEYDEAFLWAERINRHSLLWDPLLRASSLAQMGKKKEAAEVVKELITLSPNFAERARHIVGAFIFDRELQNTIIQGLILAGIKIQD